MGFANEAACWPPTPSPIGSAPKRSAGPTRWICLNRRHGLISTDADGRLQGAWADLAPLLRSLSGRLLDGCAGLRYGGSRAVISVQVRSPKKEDSGSWATSWSRSASRNSGLCGSSRQRAPPQRPLYCLLAHSWPRRRRSSCLQPPPVWKSALDGRM